MDLSVFVLGAALLAAGIEYRALIKSGRKKEWVTGVCCMACGVLLGLLHYLHVEVPSPLAGIILVFGPWSKLLESILR